MKTLIRLKQLLVWLCTLIAVGSFTSVSSAVVLPAGLIESDVPGAWAGAVGVVAGPDANGSNRLYVWEAYGKVWIVQDGVRLSTPLIDIGPEIGNYISLLGFTLDPNFQSNGYIYLLYTVDRNVLLGSPGDAPTIGRVTRYTCRASDNYTSVDPASRKVLIGATKSTGIPLIERSHGMGCLQFSRDGTLLVSTGDAAGGSDTVADLGGSPNAVQAVADGIIPAAQNVGAWRAQLVDCMSGKILRIDANTGDGIVGNPFYQTATPSSARSRVWAYGLRNPFRFTIKPNSDSLLRADGRPGTLVLGDAGWNTEDSLMVCSAPGQNFGWPAFEGFSASPGYSTATPPAGVSLAGRVQPMAAWSPTSAKARVGNTVYTMGAAGNPIPGANFGGKASIGGTYLSEAANWPASLRGQYLHMDWGTTAADSGWVKMFGGVGVTSFADGLQRVTSVSSFGAGWQGVSHLYTAPLDSELYYIVWPNIVRKVVPGPATSLGLLQERYVGNAFAGTPVTSGVNSIAFGSGLPSGLSSTRWTGFLTAPTTGNYKFYMDVNDRAKVWINDQLVLNVGSLTDGVDDYWLVPGSTLALTGGARYNLKVEYANDGGNGVAVLFWEAPNSGLTAIPESAYSFAPDSTPATINLSAPPTSGGPFQVAILFSEAFLGLTSSDFICSGGTVTGLVFANNSWSANVTPSAGATSVSVKLRAGTCYDLAGNYNEATNTTVTAITSGTAGPVPTLTGTLAAPETYGGFGLGLVWNEGVEGLTESDIVVTNGIITSLTSVVLNQYIISVQPTAAGVVTVKIPAGVCTNLSRTATNVASTLISTTYIPETNAPGVLSEFYYGSNFTTQLYTRSGGNVLQGWGQMGPLSPLGGQFTDLFSVRYSGKITPQFTESYRFLVDSDDGVRLYVNGQLILDSWSASGIRWQQQSTAVNLVAGQKYDFKLEHRDNTGYSEVYLFWQSASQPVAVVPTSAFQHGSVQDTTPPTLGLSGPASVNLAPVEVIITPGEPVVGLVATDFVLANCLLDNTRGMASLVGFSNGTYALRILAGVGTFSVSLPAGVCTDQSGNPNVASNVYTGTRAAVDTTRPAIALSGPAVLSGGPDTTGATIFRVILTPSEPVTGLTTSDFALTGCQFDISTGVDPVTGGLPRGADGNYTLVMKAFFSPGISISLPAGACVDAAGNANLASNIFTSAIRPTLTLTTIPAELATQLATPPGDFSVHLASPYSIGNISPSSFIISNGTLISYTFEFGGRFGIGWLAKIRPAAAGVVTVSLPAGALKPTGGGGPGSLASNVISVTYAPTGGGDTTPPAITLSGPATLSDGYLNPTIGGIGFEVTLTPSETITGLAITDLVLTGCQFNTAGFGPNPIRTNADGTYTLLLSSNQDVFSVRLPAATVADAAGNANTASNLYTGTRPPRVFLTGGYPAGTTPTPPGDFQVNFQLSATATGLAASDFVITNGSALSLTFLGNAGGPYHTLTVRPAAAGAVGVSLPAGAFTYPLGTANLASNTLSVTYTPAGRANGVTVAYFSDPALTNLVQTTVAPNINFDWAQNAPVPGVGADQFSLRCTGCIIPPTTGTYTIKVQADDGARLWIDNVLKFDNFSAASGTWTTTFTGTAGMPVPVKLEYREGWGGAAVIMSWSATGVPLQIIPSSRWLVNETGLSLPIRVTAAEDAAAASTQIPASLTLARETIHEIGATLTLSSDAGVLSWECPHSTVAYLHPEQSSDLQTWRPISAGSALITEGGSPGLSRVGLPVDGSRGNFFRLKAR
jgi:glucose/arabinose dehydrogenase